MAAMSGGLPFAGLGGAGLASDLSGIVCMEKVLSGALVVYTSFSITRASAADFKVREAGRRSDIVDGRM
jgi:hypothetical protein